MDVITIHRLLKNTVNADQYLLLTEAARHDLEFSEVIQFRGGQETYADIGQINTLIFSPEAEIQAAETPASTSFGARFRRSWQLFCKLWFAPFASRTSRFQHVESRTTKFGRIGFALLTALLTPLFLPVGTIFVLFHASKSPRAIQHVGPAHVHQADGSCCRGP